MKKPFSHMRRAFSFLETQVFGAVKHLSQDVNYGIIKEREYGWNSSKPLNFNILFFDNQCKFWYNCSRR